jgi:uncharacterized membrane protein
LSGLVATAAEHDCLTILGRTAGDFVAPGDVFVEIKTRVGGKPFLSPPDPKQLRGLVALGVERTIEQDPAFALRIIVDIGIKALSPAVNDPTSAVQILDYIETFLHRICTADLRDQYPYADRTGIPRVEIPGRTWAEYLQLAVTEARTYGTHSVQVCRRLRSLLNGLLVVAAPDRRQAIQAELSLSMRASRTVPRCGKPGDRARERPARHRCADDGGTYTYRGRRHYARTRCET